MCLAGKYLAETVTVGRSVDGSETVVVVDTWPDRFEHPGQVADRYTQLSLSYMFPGTGISVHH